MQSTEQSLKSELQQDLLNQLSVTDQQEVDRLNDDIRRLTQENKEAFSERMRVRRCLFSLVHLTAQLSFLLFNQKCSWDFLILV